ncbi:reelin domain-containing protein 1-like isoform X2 [Brienomyrus brachyistius]|uniref:reelin domain-containing protein 1-like isoform X2 n=1 Tax=Brienomyrus brachyistius TaxID=42636 RepID=UPI0020B34DA1|nr:reelin domain-containing protein 1-like isoform X2 [Brienomyrus brachyistius]
MKSFCELLLCVIVTLWLPTRAQGFSGGASRSACLDMKPGHIRAQPQDASRAFVTLYTDVRSYLPGDTVAVAVRSTRDIMGFLLQARTVAELRPTGSFVATPVGSRPLACVEEADTVTHADKLLKRNLSFVWRAPDRPVGDVRFLITVVQSYFVYWAGIESSVVSDGTGKSTEAAQEADGVFSTPSPGSVLKNGEVFPGGGVPQGAITPLDRMFQAGTLQPSKLDLGHDATPARTGDPTPLALPLDSEQIGEDSQTPIATLQHCRGCKGDTKQDPGESLLLPVSPEGGDVELWQARHSLLVGPDPDTKATLAETEKVTYARAAAWSRVTSAPRLSIPRAMTLVTHSRLQKAVPGSNVSQGGELGPPKEKAPDRAPPLGRAQLGILLGMGAGLGMVLAAGLRYLHSQYCWKRSEVSFGESSPRGGVIHVQECGDLVQVRKIRQDSFVVLQAEYNVLSPLGN